MIILLLFQLTLMHPLLMMTTRALDSDNDAAEDEISNNTVEMRKDNYSDTEPANNREGEAEMRSDNSVNNSGAMAMTTLDELEVEIDDVIADMETEDASVKEPHTATLSEQLEQAAQNFDIDSQRPNLRPNRKPQCFESY